MSVIREGEYWFYSIREANRKAASLVADGYTVFRRACVTNVSGPEEEAEVEVVPYYLVGVVGQVDDSDWAEDFKITNSERIRARGSWCPKCGRIE